MTHEGTLDQLVHHQVGIDRVLGNDSLPGLGAGIDEQRHRKLVGFDRQRDVVVLRAMIEANEVDRGPRRDGDPRPFAHLFQQAGHRIRDALRLCPEPSRISHDDVARDRGAFELQICQRVVRQSVDDVVAVAHQPLRGVAVLEHAFGDPPIDRPASGGQAGQHDDPKP